MKKIFFPLVLSLLSTTSFAKVTITDVDRDSAWFAAQNTTIPQSVIDKQWDQFNRPPIEVNTGKIETIKITGSECAQKYCYAYAQCPSNYKITGGGWELTQYSGGTGFSAPNASYPDVVNNRWVLYRGGMDEWRGYRAYAVCMKK